MVTEVVGDMFKCRICGEKYDHDKMASENDVSICKWCAGDEGFTDRLWFA